MTVITGFINLEICYSIEWKNFMFNRKKVFCIV